MSTPDRVMSAQSDDNMATELVRCLAETPGNDFDPVIVFLPFRSDTSPVFITTMDGGSPLSVLHHLATWKSGKWVEISPPPAKYRELYESLLRRKPTPCISYYDSHDNGGWVMGDIGLAGDNRIVAVWNWDSSEWQWADGA